MLDQILLLKPIFRSALLKAFVDDNDNQLLNEHQVINLHLQSTKLNIILLHIQVMQSVAKLLSESAVSHLRTGPMLFFIFDINKFLCGLSRMTDDDL